MTSIKRVVLSVLAAIFVVATVHADNRSKVVVIRPAYGPTQQDFFNSLAESYIYNKELADYYKNYCKDKKRFGSGFLARDSAGRLVAITNNHVVEIASTANIELGKDEAGAEQILEGCRILYRDADYDLAIIEIPQENKYNLGPDTPAFVVDDSSVAEGDKVLALGYPAISNKPSWQITQGIVSNASLVIESDDMLPGQSSIQHTAQIDGGSSGGPLLKGQPDDEASLKVVGINYATLNRRNDAYLAVSTGAIRAALDRVASQPQTLADAEKSFIPVFKAFLKSINDKDFHPAGGRRFLSYRYVTGNGWSMYKEKVFKYLDKNRKVSEAIDQFSMSTYDAIRCGVWLEVWRIFNARNTEVTLKSVESREEHGFQYFRTNLLKGGATMAVDWQLEAGTWKIIGGKVAELKLFDQYDSTIKRKVFGAEEAGKIPGDPSWKMGDISLYAVEK